MMNYEEWAKFLKQPGAIATMPYEALSKPCPKCGEHRGYDVTSDGWAYCRACSWGTSTEYPFTNRPLEIRKPNGEIDQAATDRILD
jgi:hypothetical protein